MTLRAQSVPFLIKLDSESHTCHGLTSPDSIQIALWDSESHACHGQTATIWSFDINITRRRSSRPMPRRTQWLVPCYVCNHCTYHVCTICTCLYITASWNAFAHVCTICTYFAPYIYSFWCFWRTHCPTVLLVILPHPMLTLHTAKPGSSTPRAHKRPLPIASPTLENDRAAFLWREITLQFAANPCRGSFLFHNEFSQRDFHSYVL